MEAVKDVAPIASPDFSIPEDASAAAASAENTTTSAAQDSYPAFHSVQSEYRDSTVHIEPPFYRYRVYSDA